MRVETSIKVIGGQYDTNVVLHVEDKTQIVELPKEGPHSAAEADELRTVVESKLRTVRQEVGRQLDIIHDQARISDRKENNNGI